MKLSDHVETIRQMIDKAYRNRLGRMGVTAEKVLSPDKIPSALIEEQTRIVEILETCQRETSSKEKGYEKLVEELTFTLFNRFAALKVMEAHGLHPEIITRRSQHGDRSFSHQYWLEQHPEGKQEEKEGLLQFLEDQLDELAEEIPLLSLDHPYHLLPTAIELDQIIEAFNRVEKDPQVEEEIWKSDDVLGWLYESYNNYKKKNLKESKEKTEYDKVSIQSQVYTPRWVVKFLLDNSLGKLYLEMYPDSTIKETYLIANAPEERIREPKPLTEIKIIDPAVGSGNFLLYAFDLFFDLYLNQIEQYGNQHHYDKKKIPELVISHNLHGIDIDDRAVQLAQLGLYIKAKRYEKNIQIPSFHVVSADFYLPPFEEVKHLFENGSSLSPEIEKVIRDIWGELQQAHRFGSLIRIEEKFQASIEELERRSEKNALFAEESRQHIETFRATFFQSLFKAVESHTRQKEGLNFLHTKTKDAITFLQLLTQKYEVAVANPPYTFSGDYGEKLKYFVEANYKKPYKFNVNLYTCFMKRCEELANEDGKLALIHPLTFMYIKSYDDVRKYILNKLHINVFVDYGLSNLFGSIMVDPAFYVFEKGSFKHDAWFVSLNQYTRTPNEKFKKDFCLQALADYCAKQQNKHNYSIDQAKLKIIEGWPFIYWISDGFREKFKGKKVDSCYSIVIGIKTGNNLKFLRYWWEIDKYLTNISKIDDYKWVLHAKGGPYNKWFGNLWLVINWEQSGNTIRKFPLSSVCNEMYLFQESLSFAKAGVKAVSFRLIPSYSLFDNSSPAISKKTTNDLNYLLAYLNSHLASYIIDCLNPTSGTQVGDISRIPLIMPDKKTERTNSSLAFFNIKIKKHLCSFHLIEANFEQTPLTGYQDSILPDRILSHLNYENAELTRVLLHEAIIDELVYQIYELSPEDRAQVEEKMGPSIGGLPVLQEAREAFLEYAAIQDEEVLKHIRSLPEANFSEEQINKIKNEFDTLYQSNNDLESFCTKHQVNPINVWFWFRESRVLPKGRANEIALEFLADAFRTILQEDEDGIIPLVGLPGEKRLIDRLEEYCYQKGFTNAQFMQLEGLLGRSLQEYIEHHFFKNLSDHLNLFMYLPKTPFIWHLSSGIHQGFECYILIYKWNQDSLFKLKSKYLSLREESLQNRLIQLADTNTAQALAEKERIGKQLEEIATFNSKLDELIEEGYNPILDSGVGKNIAPLQKKGLLRCDVLNPKQLKTYLEADW